MEKISKSQARRLIRDGAIDINGTKYVSPGMEVLIPMRIGKKEFLKISFIFNDEDIIKGLTDEKTNV